MHEFLHPPLTSSLDELASSSVDELANSALD